MTFLQKGVLQLGNQRAEPCTRRALRAWAADCLRYSCEYFMRNLSFNAYFYQFGSIIQNRLLWNLICIQRAFAFEARMYVYTKTRWFDGDGRYQMNGSTVAWVSLPPTLSFQRHLSGETISGLVRWFLNSFSSCEMLLWKEKTLPSSAFSYIYNDRKEEQLGTHFHQASCEKIPPWIIRPQSGSDSAKCPALDSQSNSPASYQTSHSPPFRITGTFLVRITYFPPPLPQCCHRAALNWFN